MIYTAHPNPQSTTNRSVSLRIHQPPSFEDTDPLVSETPSEVFDGEQYADEQFDLELADRILKRIESRLPGRVRKLTVYTTENAVVLAGQCSTFYSKQLAQHAAMGVLEYERLINNIEVRVTK